MVALNFSYLDVSTCPRIHSIVWCSPDGGETVRPALVRASKRDKESNRAAVLVSYGTQKLKIVEQRQLDLIIQNNGRLIALDLPCAVRFDLGLSNWLPWASDFFQPPEHSTYVLAGVLSESEQRRLRGCYKRRGIIQAM